MPRITGSIRGGYSRIGHHSHKGSNNKGDPDTYYPGSKRYVYYYDNKPHYYYSDTEPLGREFNSFEKGFFIFFAFFLLVGGIYFLTHSIIFQKKLSCDAQYVCTIDDRAGVISDENTLLTSLDKFYKKTGVCPCVVTVNMADLNKPLEKYTLELYKETYKDENHWLIVCSFPDGEASEYWYCEAAQGYNTDKSLVRANKLIVSLKSRFWEDAENISNVLAKALDKYSFFFIVPSVEVFGLMMATIMFYISILIFNWMYSPKHKKDREKDACISKAVLCEDIPLHQEKECNACGGIYVTGTCIVCPHCGADLPPVVE